MTYMMYIYVWYFLTSLGGIGSGGLVAKKKESLHLYPNYIYFYFGLENDIISAPTNRGDKYK